MKKISIAAAVISVFALVGQAQAQSVGSSTSDPAMIKVGVTDGTEVGHGSTAGSPGISITAATAPYDQMTAFSSLAAMAPADSHGVNVIKLGDIPAPSGHKQLGNFAFSKVDGQDVYFGEWAKNSASTGTTHTVYYAGNDVTANMPTQGSADYTVVGLNNYNGANKLVGTLTADFGAKNLSGFIENGDVIIDMNADINLAQASFSGKAIGIYSNGIEQGKSQGHFFGNNAEALAGTATFDGHRNLDTAFGGKR